MPFGTTIPRGNCSYIYIIGPRLTPSSMVGNITQDQNFTVQGLDTDDIVYVQSNLTQPPGINILDARVVTNNQLTITFVNVTAGALTPTAGIYNIIVFGTENLPAPINAV